MTIDDMIETTIGHEGGYSPVYVAENSPRRIIRFFPSPNSGVQGFVRNSHFLGKADKRHGTSDSFDKNTRPAICYLLLICRPSAIVRLIITVHVDAIERCAARLLPHVRKESLKAVPPLIAHRNATRPIIGKLLVGRIKASALRMGPRKIFRGARSAYGVAVSNRSGLRNFTPQAPAAFLPTALNVVKLCLNLLTTITSEKPARFWPRNSFDCDKPRKPFTRYVDGGHYV